MALKHGLLGLLNYGPATGYALDKMFKDSLNFFWQAQTSQVYRELTAMEKLGWLTSSVVVQTDKPNKKLYSLTSDGKAELMHWLTLNTIEEDIRVRDPFLVKLFFSAAMDTPGIVETMKQFKICCAAELAKIQASIETCDETIGGKNDPIFWGFTASFGYYYYDMCIRWANDTLQKLEALS